MNEQICVTTREAIKGNFENAIESRAQAQVGATRESAAEAVAEEWRAVAGYEGIYEVSNLGRVLSLPRILTDGHRRKGVMLALKDGDKGYISVALSHANKQEPIRVHILVARAFIPNPQDKPGVNHKFGNKSDNRAWMLEWATAKENSVHGFATGLIVAARGEQSGNAVLTEALVIEIRERIKLRKESMRAIALSLRVSPNAVRSIKTGRTWRHVK